MHCSIDNVLLMILEQFLRTIDNSRRINIGHLIWHDHFSKTNLGGKIGRKRGKEENLEEELGIQEVKE